MEVGKSIMCQKLKTSCEICRRMSPRLLRHEDLNLVVCHNISTSQIVANSKRVPINQTLKHKSCCYMRIPQQTNKQLILQILQLPWRSQI